MMQLHETTVIDPRTGEWNACAPYKRKTKIRYTISETDKPNRAKGGASSKKEENPTIYIMVGWERK